MAHWRVKQAIKLGKYEVPKDFKIPKYYRDCWVFKRNTGPFEYWSVDDYEGNMLRFKDYIINVLNKKPTDDELGFVK